MFYLGVTVEPSSKLFRVEFCLLSDKQAHFDILVYGGGPSYRAAMFGSQMVAEAVSGPLVCWIEPKTVDISASPHARSSSANSSHCTFWMLSFSCRSSVSLLVPASDTRFLCELLLSQAFYSNEPDFDNQLFGRFPLRDDL